ncbi:MAG: hypothetical protein ABI977_07405 [Acidobacteriota bacterium]
MSTIHDIYSVSVSQLPVSEKLQLAALILNDVAPPEPVFEARLSVRQMLREMPAGRLFETSAEADEYLERERDSWDR